MRAKIATAKTRGARTFMRVRDLGWRWRKWSGARSEEGGALVEFAISAPILLSLIFGLIEVCIALYTLQMVSEVAREGTRYAIVRGATCQALNQSSCMAAASDVNAFVSASKWPNIGGGTLSVNTTYPDGNENPASRVQVTVTYVVPFKVAFMSTKPITMSSTSVMYIIQ